MPRLVRRRPLAERIKDYLNPHDWLIWISEELETSEYAWDEWAYIIGAVFNLIFIIARSNTSSKPSDDVFADDLSSSSNLFGHLASLLVFFLTILSFTNAAYTFFRRRHYRLFEAPVEGAAPRTPSAHRVRVDSSPPSSSPLRVIGRLLEGSGSSAASRAHADAARDVWEISVWDPLPLNAKLFCAFSPGHVVLYFLLLPVSAADPRPSATVATALVLAGLLSVQLAFLRTGFAGQVRDNAALQREVMREYDAKYVHPLAHPLMRDVATQFDDDDHTFDACDIGRPVVVVRRGFSTNANPNYAKYVDPDGAAARQTPASYVQSASRVDVLKNPAAARESISPLQRAASTKQQQQQQQYRASAGPGDTGHLGVYSHPQSPLKKATGAGVRHSTQGVPSQRTGYVSTAQGPGRSRYP